MFWVGALMFLVALTILLLVTQVGNSWEHQEGVFSRWIATWRLGWLNRIALIANGLGATAVTRTLRLGTLATLTASGGVHLFFYSNSLDAVNACVRRRSKEQGLDWLDARDLTRAEAEFKEVIVVPPSAFEGRPYRFLDNGKTPILDVSGEPVAEDLKLGPKESDPVADFLSSLDSRRKR